MSALETRPNAPVLEETFVSSEATQNSTTTLNKGLGQRGLEVGGEGYPSPPLWRSALEISCMLQIA